MQRSALCRSRRERSNVYLLAKVGVDTAENEPLEVWGEMIQYYSFVSLVPPSGIARAPAAGTATRGAARGRAGASGTAKSEAPVPVASAAKASATTPAASMARNIAERQPAAMRLVSLSSSSQNGYGIVHRIRR